MYIFILVHSNRFFSRFFRCLYPKQRLVMVYVNILISNTDINMCRTICRIEVLNNQIKSWKTREIKDTMTFATVLKGT